MPNNNDFTPDERGLIPRDMAAKFRSTRAAEQWERYDSIVIGEGAAAKDSGWFDTWTDFASADSHVWFSGRSNSIGQAYSNTKTERTDWAQDIYQTLIEFIAPPGISELESDANDGLTMPFLFLTQLAQSMAFTVTLADTDDIALAPGSHFPAGVGPSGVEMSSTGSPTIFSGTNGAAMIQNAWKWPEPILLAAKSRISVTARIDSPMREMLTALTTGPGHKNIPNGEDIVELSNWYVIRVTHRGPRYLQLRGARSSA